MHYIGMDVHISTLEFAVVNNIGKLVMTKKINTSEHGMIEFIKTVPKPRKVFLEEGLLASWVHETCDRFGEKAYVTDPKKNKWISSDEVKNDEIDAIKLARLAMGGFVKIIPHSIGERRRLRELVLFYHNTIRSRTRIKNKIKSKFREYGVQCTGTTVYKKEYQSLWSKKLPNHPMIIFMIQRLFKQLEQIQDSVEKTEKILNKQSKLFPELTLLKELPGIGVIHSATMVALIEDPNRFSKRSKLWRYAGIGIVKKTSGGKIYTEQLTINYNRLLKYSIKQAALAAVQSKPNVFSKKYNDLLLKNIHPNRALLSVARSMLSTIWVIWKKGEHFNPRIK